MKWRLWLKWLHLTVLLPLLAVALLLYVMLFTQPGLRANIWLAQQLVSELRVEHSQGSVLGNMQLSGVAWHSDSLQLGITQMSSELNSHCLLQFSLCLPTLTINGLNVVVHSQNSHTAAETSEPASILLPLPIKIAKLNIDDASINVDGNILQWQQFATSINGWGSKLELDNTLWQQVVLTPVAAKPDTTLDNQPFHYIAPQLSDIQLPLAVLVKQFALTDFTLASDAPQHIARLSFRLQAVDHQIDVTDLQLQHAQFDASADLNVSLQNAYPVKADLLFTAHDSGLNGQQVALKIGGDLSSLTIQATASQFIHAELDATLALLTDELPLSVTLHTQTNNTLALSDGVNLDIGTTHVDINGNVQQFTLEAKSDYQITDLPAGALALTAMVTPTEASLSNFTLDTLGGNIALNGKVNWQSQLTWHTDVILQNIAPGLLLKDYPGQISGKLSQHGQLNDNGSWQLHLEQLDLSGTIRTLPLKLRGALDINDIAGVKQNPVDGLSFQAHQLLLEHGGNTIEFNGGLDQRWQVKADIKIDDLSKSVANSAGNLNAQMDIVGQRNTPDLMMQVTASALRYQQLAINALDADIKLHFADNISGAAYIKATDGRVQQQAIRSLEFSLSGDEQQHDLSVNVDADVADIAVELTGRLLDPQHWQGTLTQADLKTLQGHWQLDHATTLQYAIDKQTLGIQQHCWLQTATQLCLQQDAQLSQAQGNISVQLTALELNSLKLLIPGDLSINGQLDGDVAVRWSAHNMPDIHLSLQGSSGDLRQSSETPLTLPWQSFSLAAHTSNQQLQTELEIRLQDNARVTGKALISDVTSSQRTLSGHFTIADFDLAFLQPLLDKQSDVQGVISSEIELSGKLIDPELTGHLTLDQLRIKGKLAPTEIDDGRLTLQFTGAKADISGELNTPDGVVSISGDADWQEIEHWSSSLNITGDTLKVHVPNARLQIKPNLQLKMTPALTSISGVIDVPKADISIDSLPQNAVAISEDTVLLDSQLQPIVDQQTAGLNIHTDIKIVLGKDVKLNAFGLKSSLTGSLNVRQKDKGPRVSGNVALIDGTFRSYGQDLIIRHGSLKFSGPADQPYLNVEAIRNPDNTEDEVIAGIRVIGPADQPNVTIFSEPAKPQANALSYLLMGRDIGSESGSASNAVTTSLIGMSIASSGKLIGNVGEAFGINDLALDTAGVGDNSQVTVSGHLSRDLQLKYGYGIFNALGEFTLRYRLMKRLYLEAVSGLDNSVDLLYKFELD